MKWLLAFAILMCSFTGFSKQGNFSIKGYLNEKGTGNPVAEGEVFIDQRSYVYTTNKKGFFHIHNLEPGTYVLTIFSEHHQSLTKTVEIVDDNVELNIVLERIELIEEVEIQADTVRSFGSDHLASTHGTSVYEAKKTEVVKMDDMPANKSANQSREIYSKVSGLNIWESDCAGLQLDIGGRGLNPSRTASFNVRQNGYDISPDALGYPENYYTPPAELVDQIEITRGAASLQYGTQIGGVINYELKDAPKDKKIELTTRQTYGAYDFFNSSNMVAGTVDKVSYLVYYQYKQGRSCNNRPNSDFNYHYAYSNVGYQFSKKLKMSVEYTFMTYLSQQPGGLTDRQFYSDPTQSNRERNWFEVQWHLPALVFDYRFNEKTRFEIKTFALVAKRDALGTLLRPDRPDLKENRNLIHGEFQNIGQEGRLLHKNKLWGKENVVATGYRLYRGSTLSQQGQANSDSGPDFEFIDPADSLSSDYDNPSFNSAVYLEDIFHVSEKWTVTPGLRWEYIATGSQGYYKELVKANETILENNLIYESTTNKRSFVLLGLGSSYHINWKNELYANFSQNYKSITFSDLRVNNPSFKIDPDMKDETGYNFDVGLRGLVSKYIRYDASFFYLKYFDRIGEVSVWDEKLLKEVRVRTNVADSRNVGLELLFEWNVLKNMTDGRSRSDLNWFTNVSVIDAVYLQSDVPGVEGNQVELVPPFTVKTGLTYRIKSFETSLLYSYVDGHFTDASNADASSDGVIGPIPAYWVMDLSLAYSWKKLRFEGGVNNLTDNIYFTRRATSYPGPGIIPAGARSWYVTVQLKI